MAAKKGTKKAAKMRKPRKPSFKEVQKRAQEMLVDWFLANEETIKEFFASTAVSMRRKLDFERDAEARAAVPAEPMPEPTEAVDPSKDAGFNI